jgi:hypothetical protein
MISTKALIPFATKQDNKLIERLNAIVKDSIFSQIVETFLRKGETLDYANIPIDSRSAYLSFVGPRSRKVFIKNDLTYLCVTYCDNYIIEELKFNRLGNIISCI